MFLGWRDNKSLFFSCPRVILDWQQFLQLTIETQFDLHVGTTFQKISIAICWHWRNPTTFILLAEFLHSAWSDFNHFVF